MRGRNRRVDANQRAIVDAFRALGWSVAVTSSLGSGFPDLAVGRGGVNLLVEVKDGKGELTPDEARWHETWRGQVCIVRTVEDVARLTMEMAA